ncbi:hypothetical protein [Nocardia cyriacigeorgica]|uniref:hypothetical protein n=1 Tax=Nocardia cyriacigeorgica TaxID=135487 RepID=UPI0024588BDC|nr:hypothetical protein [Nocardia cyriacigeorgica]
MTAIVKMRLSGEQDAITILAEMLTAAGFDIRLADRTYPNRSGFGVRAYGEIAVGVNQNRSNPC